MSRPRREDPDRVTTTVRLPRDLHARLLAEATARDVSANWLIARLLADGVGRLVPVSEMRLTEGGEQ